VKESTKCMNPKRGCSPKRQNRLGEEEEKVAAMLKNPKQTWSYQICHSYLHKIHSAAQNYKNATIG